MYSERWDLCWYRRAHQSNNLSTHRYTVQFANSLKVIMSNPIQEESSQPSTFSPSMKYITSRFLVPPVNKYQPLPAPQPQQNTMPQYSFFPYDNISQSKANSSGPSNSYQNYRRDSGHYAFAQSYSPSTQTNQNYSHQNYHSSIPEEQEFIQPEEDETERILKRRRNTESAQSYC
jgi:hypothetical protein